MSVQLYQLVDDLARAKLGTAARELMDNWATLLADKLDLPLDVSVSGAVLTIESGLKQKLESDGAGGTQNAIQWRLPALGGLDILPVQSTLNFATGVTTGDFHASPASGKSILSNYFIQMGVELRQDGKFYAVWGDAAATLGSTTIPPFSKSKAFPLLVAKLHNNGTAGEWNFLTPAKSDIAFIKGGTGGGGGAGDTTNLIETMKNMALDLPYELLTPCVFDTDELTLVDSVSSTGAFNYADRAYGFSVSGQQFVSQNLLDQGEFIDDGLSVTQIDLFVAWKPGKIDANAQYLASRNGVSGVFEPIAMERVGNGTDSFIGRLIFDDANPVSDDLRIKVIAGSANVALDAFGVFYRNVDAGQMVYGRSNFEVQNFDSNSVNEFTLSRFIPDPDLILAVCEGAVYKLGDFTLDGHKVTFPVGFFDEPVTETKSILFLQFMPGTNDASSVNAALLAANHLGSTDLNLDRSVAGRGITLRADDGVLVEAGLVKDEETGLYAWQFSTVS